MKKSIFFSLLIFLAPFIYSQPNVNYNDVAVVINSNSQNSIDIGTYFHQARNIPNQNMIYISSLTDELIDTNQFNLIKQQIENYLVSNNLVDSINYIVLTKGVPHRIERGDCDSFSTGYNCSAMDAELTKLFYSQGFQPTNPYYNTWSNFSRAAFGMYLVTRLDGYEIGDVLDLIDNSGPNTIVHKPSSKFIFDISRATNTGEINLFLSFMQPPYDSLTGKGWMTTLDTNYSFVTNEQNVFGYYSILHQPANISLNNTWTNGSIAEILGVFSAKTFDINVNQNGYLNIADLIAEGATGAHGYAHIVFAASHLRTGILFNAYTDTVNGFNLAESYYMSITYLKDDIIIGDPKTSIIIDNTTSVDDLFSDVEFEIFPNPNNGNFSILFTLKSNEDVELNIYNPMGQIIKTIDRANFPGGKNQINISAADLSAGIYYLTTQLNEKIYVKKFVKL